MKKWCKSISMLLACLLASASAACMTGCDIDLDALKDGLNINIGANGGDESVVESFVSGGHKESSGGWGYSASSRPSSGGMSSGKDSSSSGRPNNKDSSKGETSSSADSSSSMDNPEQPYVSNTLGETFSLTESTGWSMYGSDYYVMGDCESPYLMLPTTSNVSGGIFIGQSFIDFEKEIYKNTLAAERPSQSDWDEALEELEYCKSDVAIETIWAHNSVTDLILCGLSDLKAIVIENAEFDDLTIWGCDNLQSIYFSGSPSDWYNVYCYTYSDLDLLERKWLGVDIADVYFYSKSNPANGYYDDDGYNVSDDYNFWHLVNGVPTPW